MKTLIYFTSAFVLFFLAGASGLPGQLFTWMIAAALGAAGIQMPAMLAAL